MLHPPIAANTVKPFYVNIDPVMDDKMSLTNLNLAPMADHPERTKIDLNFKPKEPNCNMFGLGLNFSPGNDRGTIPFDGSKLHVQRSRGNSS